MPKEVKRDAAEAKFKTPSPLLMGKHGCVCTKVETVPQFHFGQQVSSYFVHSHNLQGHYYGRIVLKPRGANLNYV